MQSSLHVTRQMCGTIVTCRYALSAELAGGAVPGAVEDALRDGIAHTVLEHPLMQVALLNEDSVVPSWGQLGTIDLGYHIQWDVVGPNDVYEAVFKRRTLWNMDTWFPDLETKPGWRVSALRQEQNPEAIDVMFTWNHAHFDGMGGKLFHETLLRNLNSPNLNHHLRYSSPGVLELPSAADRFPPKPEDLVKFPVSPKFVASSVWADLKPRRLISKKSNLAHWCPIRAEPFASTFRTVYIQPDTVKNLLVACRQHKTTITALLHALVLVSITLQLRKEATAFSSITALDHRRFMPSYPKSHPWFDPHKTMSNMVTVMFHDYPAKLLDTMRAKIQTTASQTDIISTLEDIVWSVAARTRGEVEGRLEAGLKNDIAGLLKFVGDWRGQMRNTAKRPRAGSWAVTNLGAIDGSGKRDDGWRITRGLFQISTEITAGAFNISVVSVKGGELSVDIGWQECTMDAALGDRLTSDLNVWLNHLGAKKEVANGMVD